MIKLSDRDASVKDQGLKPEPKINPIDSVLYGTLDHGHPIMGDILFTQMEEVPEGRESVDMPDVEIKWLGSTLKSGKTAMKYSQ